LSDALLKEYVNRLQKEGWQCHIIAHSRGGNIVIEALPEIANRLLGKIITLGTPFIDHEVAERRTR
jgi:esterase/lipase superfamily enzyme